MNIVKKKINSFEDLVAWQTSSELVLIVYKSLSTFPSSELFSLVDQIKRSSISVSANIAEGWGVRTYKDTLKFYYIAQGSSNELKSHLLISYKLGYLTKSSLDILLDKLKHTQALLAGLIRSTRKLKKDL